MTNSNGHSPQHTAQILANRGREALRVGQRHRARRYFTAAIANDLTCVAAWRGLADVTVKPQTALRYLQRAQDLAPDDASLRWAIQRVQGQIQQTQSVQRPLSIVPPNLSPARLEPYSLRWRWVIVGLILLLTLVAIVVVGLSLAPVISAQGLSPQWSLGLAPPSEATGLAPSTGAARESARARLPAPNAASLVRAGRAALAAGEWSRALTLLEAARHMEPGDQAITSVLYRATLDWGQWHVIHNRYTAAIVCFDRAQTLDPDNRDLILARRQATALRRGRHAILRENWAEAIAVLAPIYTTDPAHPHLADWLYQAYCQRGRELEKQGQWSSAKSAYTHALQVRPKGWEAQQGLVRVEKGKPAGSQPSAPVTPLTGKWIDIDLSQQTLTAYQGSRPLLSAVVSTGTRRYPTPTGRFAIQRKYRFTHMSGPGYSLPNVPYAMFFVGGYAIHGTYWHNNFGTPMSHGCVNMRTDEAGWLYNWAPKGTPVVIHY